MSSQLQYGNKRGYWNVSVLSPVLFILFTVQKGEFDVIVSLRLIMASLRQATLAQHHLQQLFNPFLTVLLEHCLLLVQLCVEKLSAIRRLSFTFEL